jgi:putative DNA methylase
VVVVDSFVLRENESGDNLLLESVYKRRGGFFTDGTRAWRITDKDHKICPECGQALQEMLDVTLRERYEPIAVSGVCPRHGPFFKAPDDCDLAQVAKSPQQAASWRLSPRVFAIPTGPKSSDLRNKGVKFYWDLFTGRQIRYLRKSAELIRRLPPEERDMLGLLVSTSLDFNSLLCGYKGAGVRRPGAVRHVFALHAYSLPYTALENNPIATSGSSGTVLRLFRDRIWRGSVWASEPEEPKIVNGRTTQVAIKGETDIGNVVSTYDELLRTDKAVLVHQGDARCIPLPDRSVDHVVTDPPYFDNVQYSDLSRFFRVWLGQFLRGRARWTYSPTLSAVAGDQRTNGDDYCGMMTSIWRECRRVMRPGGRLVFTFHHWSPQAWTDLSVALQRSDASLVNVYVLASENPTSVHIAHLNSIRHDCVLVLGFDAPTSARRLWARPSQVRMDDSYDFCRDCGAALGWLLQERLCGEAVSETWSGLLGQGRELRRTGG